MGRRSWLAATAGVIALCIVLQLTVFAGGVKAPEYLLGFYGPRTVPSASGPRCHGAAARAASAVRVPSETDTPSKLLADLPSLFPDQYAGISLSNHNSTINIYETCSSPNMTRIAVLASPRREVHFLFVPNTWSELNRAFDKLNEATRTSPLGRIAGYGIDVSADVVTVQVVNLTRQQLDRVDLVAPRGLLQVQGITKAQVGHEL